MKLPFAMFAAGLLATALAAQDNRGEILGSVKDASGAVVAGARIQATPGATGEPATPAAPQSAVTDRNGEFRLPFLMPGLWNVSVEHPGFRGFREENVAVRAAETSTLEITLEVGPSSETVHVVARPPLLNLTDPSSGMTVVAEDFQELPLKDGNPMMLAILAPGVANLSEGGTVRPFDNENASALAINGSSSGTHEFKVDGAANTGGTSGNVANVPPANMVGEFTVATSPFDARNGFSSGGAISLNLRPGGNKIHGQIYGYAENPATNANSFFSNKSASGKDNFREARWGLGANGPLYIPRLLPGRNRTFFVYGYEGIHATQPYRASNLTYTVPTAAERQGNLSDLLAYGAAYQIYDPKTTRPAASGRYTRDPFPGNLIPSSRLDATAQNLMARFYPLPNIPGAKPTGVNYTMPSLQANRFENQMLRIDRALGEKHRLYVRGNMSDRAQDLERRFQDAAGLAGERENRGFGLDEAYMISTRTLLDLRYNYTRYVDNMTPPSAGIDLASLGFSQTYVNQIRGVDPRNLMLPDITPAGYPEMNGYVMSRLSSDIHAAAIDLTRVAGAHTLHVGGEHRVYRDASANTGRSAGKLNFNSNWTLGPLDNAAAAPIGQGLASFLLGLPTDGQMDVNPSLAQQYQVTGWYAHDTWKAHPRLTVNLGLRWEMEVPVTERYNRSIRGFDFGAVSPIAAQAQANYAKAPNAQLPAALFQVRGGVTFAGVNGPRELWAAQKHNFAPRAGIAWRYRNATVIRAGYGMFFDIARQNAIQTGFSRTTSLVSSTDSGQTYQATIENPFPKGFDLPVGSALGLMTNAGQSLTVFPGRLLNPYQQRWEFTVQRSLGNQALIEIGYVGSRGTHLRTSRQLDPLPDRYLSTYAARDNARYTLLTTNVSNPFYPLLPNTSLSASTLQLAQLLRPYPQFTGITAVTNDGFSWYHSLQARMQKRFGRNYQTIVAYTWSKYLEAINFLNEGDATTTHVVSSQDRTHRIVATGIWQIPLAKGRRGMVGLIAAGWQLQGIYQRQSGAPLSFGNVLWYGGDIHDIAGGQTAAAWFNTANFERNAALQLVDNLRTFPLRLSGVRTMGLNLLDAGISKNQRLREGLTMQLRADAFNSMNHTHFGAPNTSPTSTDFGSISTTSQQPRVIEFSLRVSF